MAYTVKQIAEMSGVSIRTLHFYDETGLLKPAYQGANSYRIYEEPQLLQLQQILFYRELGFELKQIKQILSRDDFDVQAALDSHRALLHDKLVRMHRQPKACAIPTTCRCRQMWRRLSLVICGFLATIACYRPRRLQ